MCQNSSLTVAKVLKAQTLKGCLPETRGPGQCISICTHEMQPCVTCLRDANTCGHHFISTPQRGQTEPGTLSCSTATCIHPVLLKTSTESPSHLLSPCSSSESRLSQGISNVPNTTDKVCRSLAVWGLLSLKQSSLHLGVQAITLKTETSFSLSSVSGNHQCK